MSEEVKNYIENTDFNKYKLVVDREYKETYIQGLEQENERLKKALLDIKNKEKMFLHIGWNCDDLEEILDIVNKALEGNDE